MYNETIQPPETISWLGGVCRGELVVLPFRARVSDCCYALNFVLFCFCCFTSRVNSYGHCETVSSLNHTFSWAGLSKRLTSNLCTYFRL